MSTIDQHIEAVAAWSRVLKAAKAEADDAQKTWSTAADREDDARRELSHAQRALLDAIAEPDAEEQS